MLFSELYSVYYNTVARIIRTAFEGELCEKELRRCVSEEAFAESVITILPSLKSGKWPLFDENMCPRLENIPTMPLTTLEKRWLKAVSLDPRIRLFGVEFPELSDTDPLFTSDDYRVFDKYSDGDPFEDEEYIERFRLIFSAMKKGEAVRIYMKNRYGKSISVRFYPKAFEYSEKDDKIRIIADGCKFRHFNLARITFVKICEGGSWEEEAAPDALKNLTLYIRDEKNALERVLLHFAHFEKRTERISEKEYILHMNYYESDETEIVIRVLSFGPRVKVVEPQSFVELIRERLKKQLERGPR